MAEKAKKVAKAKFASLPSKDDILQFIENSESHVGKREIARAFQIKGDRRIWLKKLLKEMKDEGLLVKPGKNLTGADDLPAVGVLRVASLTSDGEAVAVPDSWTGKDDAPKIIIAPSKHSTAPGIGSRVLGRLKKTKGRFPYQAKIIRILEDDGKRALGIYRRHKDGNGQVEPIDKKARKHFIIASGEDMDAEDGSLVEVEIKPARSQIYGLKPAVVRKKLGDVTDPKSISLIAIHQFGIPHKFPEKAVREARDVTPTNCDREDWRSVDFITIDPVDAKDHDDAVWAGPDEDPANPDGHIVKVAIADVAAYVKPGSILDKCAQERGNSVYFPGYVEPMIPKSLSHGACSLSEGDDRPALAVMMRFTKNGEKIEHRFSRIMMRSRAKLSYQAAQASIDQTPHEDSEKTAPLHDTVLAPLWAAYGALERARAKRQPLDLDLPERRIILDETGRIERIYVPERFDAHKLIEEMMIQANVAAAETLQQHKHPLIFRIHESPDQEKVHGLADFMRSLDIKLSLGGRITPELFNGLLTRAKDTDLTHLVSQAVLRAQSQAVYDPDNKGHFGLNLANYAHFTSPIRRYADLVVHRALISALKLGDDGMPPRETEHLQEIAEHISNTERTAMAAERATSDRLLSLYLSDQIGAEFDGVISGVTKAGLFVELSETGADGFCPARFIGTEYYIFDEKKRALIGEHSGHTYRLGHNVAVRLIEAAPVAGALRFEVISGGEKGKKPGQAKRFRRGKSKPGKKIKSKKRRR